MKTLQEHLDTTGAFYSFIIDLVWDQHRRHPDRSCGWILVNWTMFRYLQREGVPDVSGITPFMEHYIETADALQGKSESAFREGMESLRAALLERAASLYPATFGQHPMYQPGCSFRWQQGSSGELPPTFCIFHMYNALAPKSFLADPAYFTGSLERIIVESAEKGCTTLYTMTWLNSNEHFLRFFPEEWHNNLGIPYESFGNDLGVNGQFINAAGNLNVPNARYVLETGRLRYQPRKSHCSFEAALAHLKRLSEKEN